MAQEPGGISVTVETRSPWARGPVPWDGTDHPDCVARLLPMLGHPLSPSCVNFRLVPSFLVAVIELGVICHLAHF